ncbi:hypothetical protein DMENIID0001_149450 [Sergentomyia squamirostris]
MEASFCEEIKKIPFKVACESLGVDELETKELMKIEKNKELIEEGFNDLYYLLTFGIFESDILAKYSSLIVLNNSSSRKKSPRNSSSSNHMKLVRFCFSPNTGLSVSKDDVERFARAAEDFALFGMMEPEDVEVLFGENNRENLMRKQEELLRNQKKSQNVGVVRNLQQVPRPNPIIILNSPSQILMPVLCARVPILFPILPQFRTIFPTNLPRWIVKNPARIFTRSSTKRPAIEASKSPKREKKEGKEVEIEKLEQD